MNIQLVYFSPTDSTKNVIHKVVESMNAIITEEYNLTNQEYEDFNYSFDENDLVLLGFPVYGGRLPETAKNRFIGLKGKKTKIAIILTYGDVHYDDSLIETHEIMKNNGFITIGMGAFVVQHNIVKTVGINRPNDEDYKLIIKFGKELNGKINENKLEELKIASAKPFGKYKGCPVKPKGNRNCSKCGLCVKLCPQKAIKANNPRKNIKNKCISCMRCVKYCSKNARDLTPFEYFVSKIFIGIVKKTKFKKENKSEIIV